MEWISVEDRLPETNNAGCIEVLALVDGKFRYVIDFINDYGQKEWYFDGFRLFKKVENVTHWMPLPEPPKE